MSAPAFHLHEWLVEPDLNRVSRAGESVQIEPRLMKILLCLARRPGEVVTRRELFATVWADMVVVEKALTVSISELRRILGDDPTAPRYIETIRKGGYRLIAPVRGDEDPARRRRLPGHVIALVGLIFVSAVVLPLWLSRPGSTPAGSALFQKGVPFTSYGGPEAYPALSPDGMQVAFTWAGTEGVNLDIYIKQRNTEAPLRLTAHPAAERFPTWSPDGSTIAFARGGERPGIYTIPAIGGNARRLIATGASFLGMDWSPDGRAIAYTSASEENEYPQIRLLSLETLESETLTSATGDYMCAFLPAFAPDGRSIAFARSDNAGLHDIHLVSIIDQTIEQLTRGQRKIFGLDWSPDGRHIYFTSAPVADQCLWRLALDDRSVIWIPASGQPGRLSVARALDRLIFEDWCFDLDIWSADLTSGQSRALISSTREDFDGCFSPDGRRIAFISSRSGNQEIWICDADGRAARQLTSLGSLHLRNPLWSPDGRCIAFAAIPQDYCEIYIAELASGHARPLHPAEHHQVCTCWSMSGDWIYYNADRGAGWEMWRMRADGGVIEPIHDGCYSAAHELNDGALVAVRRDRGGIWRIPRTGDSRQCLITDAACASWLTCDVVAEGVYFTKPAAGKYMIGFYDFARGTSDSLLTVNARPARLTASPKRGRVIFDLAETFEADLILLDHLDRLP